MQTIASKGPAPLNRQASARESRWNWSQDTGKIFAGSTGLSGSGVFIADRLVAPDSRTYRALIQSITCRRATSAVVRCPAMTSTYWLFGFLASALKAYSGPRRSIGSSLPTTQSSGTGEGAAPISAAFLGITAGPSGSNQLK